MAIVPLKECSTPTLTGSAAETERVRKAAVRAAASLRMFGFIIRFLGFGWIGVRFAVAVLEKIGSARAHDHAVRLCAEAILEGRVVETNFGLNLDVGRRFDVEREGHAVTLKSAPPRQAPRPIGAKNALLIL